MEHNIGDMPTRVLIFGSRFRVLPRIVQLDSWGSLFGLCIGFLAF